MPKLSLLTILSVLLVAVSSDRGGAFQLFGAHPSSETVVAKEQKKPEAGALGGGDALALGGKTAPQSDKVGNGDEIWIPGLGVVGKMPDFNFGLEMLYGGKAGPDADVPAEVLEFDRMDDDFSIKGTIKRKF